MERSKKIIQVSLIGIAANLILVALKAFVGIITGSIANAWILCGFRENGSIL